MSQTWPLVPLGGVLHLTIDAVPVAHSDSFNLYGLIPRSLLRNEFAAFRRTYPIDTPQLAAVNFSTGGLFCAEPRRRFPSSIGAGGCDDRPRPLAGQGRVSG